MVLNVLFGVKRRDGGLGELSTEQVTVLHVPLMLFSAAKTSKRACYAKKT